MEIKLPQITGIGIYNSNITVKNKTVTNNRRTSMFEIEIPLENGGVSYIDSDKMKLKTDIIICAKPGQIRHTKLPFKCYYIHFTLPESELYTALCKLPNYLKTDKTKKYCEIFRKLYQYYNVTTGRDDIIIQSLVLELFHNLIKDSRGQELKQQMKNGNYDAIVRATDFIKNNLTGDLNLNNISAVAGFSPTYFHKLFKSFTGQTVCKYIEEKRIQRALNFLLETDFTVTEIAYSCGFSSQSYFNYAFKRKMKITPKQYAKEFYKQYTKSI